MNLKHIASSDKLISLAFDEYDAGGGGSCLFYCLAAELLSSNSLTSARQIRKEICNYNPNDLKDFVAIAEHEESMCDDKTYGTTIEIQKAARLYNRPIIVYKKNRNDGIASDLVCPGSQYISQIKSGKIFPSVSKYFNKKPYTDILPRLYCIYFPEKNTNNKPIIIYNIGDIHYRVLKDKFSKASRKSSKAPRKSLRKSVRKSVRKSRKSVRKNRKVSRKSRKVPRKSRKVPRKSRKVPRKSRKVPRKSRKVPRKSRKVPRKSRKILRKSRKT